MHWTSVWMYFEEVIHVTKNEQKLLDLLNNHNKLTIQYIKGDNSGQLMSDLADNHRRRIHARLMGFIHANKTWHSMIEV